MDSQLTSGEFESRYSLADALAQLGEHDRVITELQTAVSIDKANPAATITSVLR